MSTKRAIGISVLSSLLTLAVAMALLASSRTAIAQDPESTPVTVAAPQSPEPLSPDSNDVTQPAAPEAPDAVAATSYQHVSGSVFVPLWDTAQAVYAGSGCKYLTGSNLFLNSPLNLPYKSTVTQLRLYYKDTSASNGTLWLARYDDGLAYTYLITLTTTGSGGWGTATASANLLLDYDNYSYTLVWSSAGVASPSLQFCGFRVGYTPPSIFGVALPVLTK